MGVGGHNKDFDYSWIDYPYQDLSYMDYLASWDYLSYKDYLLMVELFDFDLN